ncbi:MAG: hypothetical protein A2X18_04090 [Bacteroidetes bacterium GWF2_40_14]|nr:MAG: hypothetical protein A2X18_04090 [Bacteroidetes bacterium GWF2_40_14]
MKNNFLKFLVTALVSTTLFSCIEKLDPIEVVRDGKVLVINQGNYSEQSASISLYDETTKQIQNRVYETANGISIGATIVSGTIGADKEAILVCNNPDKIIFIDAKTGKDKGTTITEGLASPRNVVITSDFIYITNWDYDHIVNSMGFWEFNKSYIAVYNATTKALIKKVPAGTDAEGLALYGNKLFVAVKEGVRVFDISKTDMPVLATIRDAGTTGSAKHLTFDRTLKIWASFPEKGVVQIDPAALTVSAVVAVPVDFMDGYITTDATGSNILTYNTTFDANYNPEKASLYSVNVQTKAVKTLYEGTYFYGVGVSPLSGDIFTAEVSFTSNSILKVVAPDGTLRNSATAGIGTCRYLFF